MPTLPTLISDWRSGWRWFSVQAMSLSIAIMAAWVALPDAWKSVLPTWVFQTIVMAVLALGIIGRFIPQENTNAQ